MRFLTMAQRTRCAGGGDTRKRKQQKQQPQQRQQHQVLRSLQTVVIVRCLLCLPGSVLPLLHLLKG
jgi:hypothetical protein